MKLHSYTIVLLIASLFVVVSCTKKEVEPTNKQLVGTWVLTQKKISKEGVTTELAISKSLQTLTFISSNQLRSTVFEGDTLLANASYYRIGYSDIAGPYLEVRKTSTDTQSRSYFYGVHSDNTTLHITDYDTSNQSNIVYEFRHQ